MLLFLLKSVSSNLEALKYFIENGNPDLNACSKNGGTVLHLAAEMGHLEVVKYLVEKGANVNAKDNRFGWPPLRCAVDKGHSEIADYLRSKGAEDVRAKNNEGHQEIGDCKMQ